MISWMDLAPYIDPNGLVADRPNPTQSTGNALLRTAQAMRLLYAQGGARHGELTTLASAMVNCKAPWPNRGLFHRTPKGCEFHFDQESQDDYIGIGAMAYLGFPQIAVDVLKYGREHKFTWKFLRFRYYFRTDGKGDPGTKLGGIDDGRYRDAWLGRFPSLITHLEWAAGEKPNWLRRLCWAYSIAFCADTQDSWALTDLMVFVAGKRGWLERLATAHRARRLKKLHPGGMSGILLAYFAGHMHPIAAHYDDKEST